MTTMKPHLRLTMSGLISDFEIFSCSLSLEPQGSTAWGEILSVPLPSVAVVRAFLDQLEADGFEDLVTDCVNFWVNPANNMTGNAKLRKVTLAAIGTDGKYTAAPLESAVVAQGQAAIGTGGPPQVSHKVTLETDGDIGRVKGGFYLPCPSLSNADGWFEPSTGLFSVARTEQVRDAVKGFLDNLQNAPGLDTYDLRVVVAGGPRHRSDGTVRLAADNYDVLRVNVGRRPDVQRRRANKRSEARISDVALA